MHMYVFWQANISKGEPRQSELAKMQLYVLRQAKMLIYGHRRAKII